MPKGIATAPRLLFGSQVYWNCFWDIAPGCGEMMAWHEINSWGQAHGASPDQSDDLVFHCRGMYLEFREFLKNKRNKPIGKEEDDRGDDGRLRAPHERVRGKSGGRSRPHKTTLRARR